MHMTRIYDPQGNLDTAVRLEAIPRIGESIAYVGKRGNTFARVSDVGWSFDASGAIEFVVIRTKEFTQK